MKKNVIKKVAGAVAIFALLGAFVSCNHGGDDPTKSDPVVVTGGEETGGDEGGEAGEETGGDEGEEAGEETGGDEGGEAGEETGGDEGEEAGEETGTALNAASGWWVNMLASDIKVDSGSSIIMKFKVDTVTGTDNWSTPDFYLVALNNDTKAWLLDEAILRTDNYGWGDGYSTATLDSNWNWSTFLSSIAGSTYTVTIKNYGSTADVLMEVKGSDGNNYHQYYTGITIANPDNVYVRLSGDAGAWSGTYYSTEVVSLSE